MQKLEEVYARLNESKNKRRELNKMLKDELAGNARFQEIQDEMKTLRDEKKGIENDVRSMSNDLSELDDLKIEIMTDTELLSDIALNMYMNKETVEIKDDYDNTWYPQFVVKFKKS